MVAAIKTLVFLMLSVMNRKIIYLLSLFSLINCYGQSDFFTNFSLGKNFSRDRKLLNSAVVWKHIYNDIGWSRIAFNNKAQYAFKDWRLLGGMNLQYTFDREMENLLEIRPWLGVGLKNEIVPGLNFEQEVRAEYRIFFYPGMSGRNYIRTRVEAMFSYNLEKIKLDKWDVHCGYVWYIIKDPLRGERYSDSREFKFLVSSNFQGGKLTFGYKNEKFRLIENRSVFRAHTFEISYIFD